MSQLDHPRRVTVIVLPKKNEYKETKVGDWKYKLYSYYMDKLNSEKLHFCLWIFFPPLTHRTRLVSKDVEFYCASFDISGKFVASCPPMETPTRKLKNEFSGRNSHGIYPNLEYFGMILKALQTLLFKIKIHPSMKKTPKSSEFSLRIVDQGWGKFFKKNLLKEYRFFVKTFL